MKLIVFLVCFVYYTNAIDEAFMEQTRAKVRKAVEECVTEEGASDKDFEDIKQLKIPESHQGKCVFFCAHKKFDLQHADGSINKEGAMSTFEVLKDVDVDYHDKLIKAYTNCLSTPVNSDPCLYSVSMFQCLWKEATAVGIHELIIK